MYNFRFVNNNFTVLYLKIACFNVSEFVNQNNKKEKTKKLTEQTIIKKKI